MKKISLFLLTLSVITYIGCKNRSSSGTSPATPGVTDQEQRLSLNERRSSEQARSFKRRLSRSRTAPRTSGRTRLQQQNREHFRGGASNADVPEGQTGRRELLNLRRRKISRNANLSIKVKTFQKAYKKIIQIVDATAGAYISNSSTYERSNGLKYGNITVKVPSENFTDLFENVKAIGKIKSETIRTKDFTKLYYDLEARLRAEQNYKERLEQIMRKRARTYDEVQDAYNRIRRVQQKIERIKGNMRFINAVTTYSTIKLRFYEGKSYSSGTSSFGGAFQRVWDGIKSGFKNMILVFGFILEYAITLSILIALFILGYFLTKKYYKRIKEKSK